MSLTSSPAPAETLLGNFPGKLRLRIRGTRRDGQTIGLRSPKITIGSSPNCTLRLRGPGIAPLHCLILRGHDRTIVRRWAPDTRLNDDTFEDATLNPGDRLTIGPIGLDVLEAELASLLTDTSSSFAALVSSPLPAAPVPAVETSATASPELEAQWRERLTQINSQSRGRARWLIKQLRGKRQQFDLLQHAVASSEQHALDTQARQSQLEGVIHSLQQQLIEATARQSADDQGLRQQQIELEERAQKLSLEKTSLASLQKTLDDDCAALSQNRSELDSERAALDQQRRTIDQLRQSLAQQQQQLAHDQEQAQFTDQQRQSAVDEREAALRRRALELDTQSHDLARREQELAKHQVDHQSTEQASTAAQFLQSQLAQQAKQLDADRDELAGREAKLASERQQFEHSTGALAAQRQELDQKSAALTSQRKQLEQDTKQLQQNTQQLESAQQKLKAAQQKLAADRQQLQSDLQSLASDRAQLQAKLQQESIALEQLQHEQSARENQWNAQRAQQEASLDQQAKSLEARTAEVEQQRDELARQRAQIEHDRQAFDQQAASEREPSSPPPAPLADRVSPVTISLIPRPQPIEPARPADPEHAATEKKSSDDEVVFARLRALALLKDAPKVSEPAPAHRDNDSASAASEAKTTESSSATEVKTDPPKASGNHEEDVSIDDYMAKLLERMRGPGGADSPAPVARSPKPTEERTPAAAPTNPELPANPSVDQPKPTPKPMVALEAPRNAAPENSRHLAAMREIANQSARSAIATHHHRARKNRAWTTLAVGAICFVCGVTLIYWTPDISEPMFYVGIAGLIVALGCFGRSVFSARVARIWKHRRQQQHLATKHSGESSTATALTAEASDAAQAEDSAVESPTTEAGATGS